MHLPAGFAAVILTFTPLFLQQRTWRHAELLLIGAILAPGKRTVTSLLRITGLSREQRFATCHRVLNRAVWDPPFLTVLAPSERYCHQRGRRHKKLP